MATPKPGEIRCPTCHRSTPPAAFCTQCGSAIPSDARIRPRGMDRDELQDRIRARRSGSDPYRRGGVPDATEPGYERFEQEPEDSHVRRVRRPTDRRQDSFRDGLPPVVPLPAPVPEPDEAQASLVPPIAPRPDVTREADDWTARPATDPTPTPLTPPPSDLPVVEDVDYVDNFDDAAYEEAGYPYANDDWDDGRQRSSGAGAFAILGLLALGVLALLGGAVVAGIFSGDPNTGANDPTLTPSPTLSETLAPSPSASVAPSAAASGAPSASAPASGEPVVFPDGFTAETQPCIPGSASTQGCDSNARSNSGSVWVWVGFTNGKQADVLAARLTGPDGTVIGEGAIDLERIGCRPACRGGWTYFPFGNLPPGTYQATVERNGELAAETEFTVE
jgi:hypothetical protein